MTKDPFRLSNFCTGQNTVLVQPVYMVEPPDVQRNQPAAQPVEEEHPLPVQSMLTAVVDVQLSTLVMRSLYMSNLTSPQSNLSMISLLTSRHNTEEAEGSARKDLTPSILIICDMLV